MGIRIEDSIAVQEEHPFVLTTEAVKEVRFRSLCTVGVREWVLMFWRRLLILRL